MVLDLKIAPSGQTIVKPTALGPVANTDTKAADLWPISKGPSFGTGRGSLRSWFSQPARRETRKVCGETNVLIARIVAEVTYRRGVVARPGANR